jgi:hypothetical protein
MMDLSNHGLQQSIVFVYFSLLFSHNLKARYNINAMLDAVRRQVAILDIIHHLALLY